MQLPSLTDCVLFPDLPLLCIVMRNLGFNLIRRFISCNTSQILGIDIIIAIYDIKNYVISNTIFIQNRYYGLKNRSDYKDAVTPNLCILIFCYGGPFVAALGVFEVVFGRWAAANHIEFRQSIQP